MSNLFVKHIPSVQERSFKYRAPISSSELNNMQTEVFNDILDLFNKSNQLQKNIYEINLAHNIESVCYSKRLEDAIASLNKLTEIYNNTMIADDDFRTITRYAFEAHTTEDGYSAVVDKNTNDITARIVNSISKIRIYDSTYDETIVPPSLQAYVGPDTFKVGGNIYSIEDSDINNAFDGNNGTIWLRKVTTSTDVEYIENEITIGLPEDIITTRLMNQIVIKPFPVGFVDILDIKYKSNGAWQTIPKFAEHEGCEEYETTDIFGNTYTYRSINDASNVKFNFHNIQSSQLKIKLRQRNYEYDAENNRRIWYLGLRDVDVLHNTYTRDCSEFEMVFEFPETDRNIKVYDSQVFLNNSGLIDDAEFGISKEYFYYDSNNHTHKIPSTCPFVLQGHKLMVRYTIEGTQVTPNIHKCNIKYKLT